MASSANVTTLPWRAALQARRERLPAIAKDPQHQRFTLHASSIALVEDVHISPDLPAPSGHEANHQIIFTHRGMFAYAVSKRTWLVDSNDSLFVTPGRDFRDSHPVPGLGHHSVIITPARDVLDELCGGAGASSHGAFVDTQRRATERLRLMAHRILRAGARDPLDKDEWTVATIAEALVSPARRSPAQPRVVDRAKQYLHAHGFERLTLERIAHAVGVSPVYLTQEFSRSEGIPLYRYQLQLRLNQALAELPQCEDITGLALDLGFSSHSHFSAAFKSVFALTPSEYRRGLVGV